MESHNRIGRISSIDYKKGTADVYFEYYDEELKTKIPFLSFEYKMPEINDLVLVAFQKYHNREQGYIIGKYFNEENLPEEGLKAGYYFKRLAEKTFVREDDKGNIRIQLSDTASIDYNAASDILTITAGKVHIVNTRY